MVMRFSGRGFAIGFRSNVPKYTRTYVFATTPPPRQRLLVFARVPELGHVKSRLAAAVGQEKALAIYEAMLQQLLSTIGDSTADTEIEIAWAPTPRANGDVLRRAFGDRTMAMQTGPTLGDRMAMAFSERFFFHRTMKIIAIGVDDPALSRDTVDHAFGLLDSCDWVVGPAIDGGYYLIGCRAAAFRSDIFTSIDWGTASVFSTTMARIRSWENTVAVLPRRYDIDVVEDLQRYIAEHPDDRVSHSAK
jgi:rSAM/selenodomain-associated transferase 1